jgi:pilus assembly protein CpaB
MGRRTLLLIASIIVAATGTGLVALYASNAKSAGETNGARVDVYVAVNAVALGTTLQQALKDKTVILDRRARGGLPDGALTEVKTLAAQKAVIAIPANTVLSPSLFSATGQNPASNPVGLDGGAGLVAISVNVADVDRVAGFVQPGNYVALIATTNADDPVKAASHILFERPVKVLQIALLGAKGPTAGQTLVTLQLDQPQANKVALAASQAKLTMALVSGKDVVLDTNDSATPKQLEPSGTPSSSQGSGNP